MKHFRVKFYYSATGSDEDKRDYGRVVAETSAEAVELVLNGFFPKMNDKDREFCRGCLTAKEVK